MNKMIQINALEIDDKIEASDLVRNLDNLSEFDCLATRAVYWHEAKLVIPFWVGKTLGDYLKSGPTPLYMQRDPNLDKREMQILRCPDATQREALGFIVKTEYPFGV
tara:strand:+ start:186 stop:506 length:321 start_codon:yes stop_codon:yes gene_type:complete